MRGEFRMPLNYDKIMEFWQSGRFPDAFDLFGKSLSESLISPEEVAKFWGLIERECEENPEVTFGLYQMVKKARNWDDETLCSELRITPEALDDVKNKRRSWGESAGLKMLYDLFPQMMV